jgi:hypothetical protein
MKDARETPIEDEEGLTGADGLRHDSGGLRASEEPLRLATPRCADHEPWGIKKPDCRGVDRDERN